jgi:hypothetical protein
MVTVSITGTKHFEGGRMEFPSWDSLMHYFGADQVITEPDSDWFELRGKYRIQGQRISKF